MIKIFKDYSLNKQTLHKHLNAVNRILNSTNGSATIKQCLANSCLHFPSLGAKGLKLFQRNSDSPEPIILGTPI